MLAAGHRRPEAHLELERTDQLVEREAARAVDLDALVLRAPGPAAARDRPAHVERPDEPARELGDPRAGLGDLHGAAVARGRRRSATYVRLTALTARDVAQEVARHVDHVGAHVRDDAGAAAGSLVPPRERGRGIDLPVGEVGHPPVADLAEVALVDQALQIAERGGEPERERDHVHPARGAVGGVGQRPGLRIRDRQRLLAEDVLAGGDRGGGDRRFRSLGGQITTASSSGSATRASQVAWTRGTLQRSAKALGGSRDRGTRRPSPRSDPARAGGSAGARSRRSGPFRSRPRESAAAFVRCPPGSGRL